jgi:hypothetical protein
MVVLGLVAGGCGDGDGGARKDATAMPAGAPAPPRPAEDGVLTDPNGRKVRAVGDYAVHRRVVATLRRLQRAFRAGDYAEACKAIDPFLLSQFQAAEVGAGASCTRRLASFARSLPADRKPRALRASWVRSYTDIAGLWVEPPVGDRIRVPFNNRAGDGWDLELGTFTRPGVLADELTGTPAHPAND